MTDLGPFIRTTSDVPLVPFLGLTNQFTLPAEATGGALTLIDAGTIRKNFSPPLHHHLTEHEVFLVTSGVVDFACGDTRTTVEGSGAAFLPAGRPHSFRVVEDARIYVITVPSGAEPAGDFERFVHDVSAAGGDLQAVAELGERHRIPIVGPPLAE
ncbi:hypothetical protein Lesp02_76970 [Lentzea sp. NBRC 105346]|uniref:AraC family ligand binding domain-containing protein n=1 Tax=Lentzea sp. NBRC 105346 TaxID=3032205 RepID=UPI0024A1FB55|nr:AraC family ligand binding domain-containing protein [Lentzea sp. NBRC 105346]GLZ35510.1 hypothetical protein Lesp02_76970 [Lentzea sp. NBRC 105346]